MTVHPQASVQSVQGYANSVRGSNRAERVDDTLTQKEASHTRQRNEKSAKQESLLEGAMQLFAELDSSEVTVEAICKRSHVSKATFYQNFHSRADIERAIVQRITKPVARPLPESRSEGLAELFVKQAHQFEAHPRLARLACAQMLTGMCESRHTRNQPFLAAVERRVLNEQAAGAIRRSTLSPELARIALSVFATTVLQWTSYPSGAPLGSRVQEALTACLQGWSSPTQPNDKRGSSLLHGATRGRSLRALATD